MYACNGILFNHESPIRGETFVTRKITRGVSEIVMGLTDKLFMGNLSAKRDWGHAKDYVKAMYLMLQQDKPEDFVIATGITTEVREFVKLAFAEVGVTIEFKGNGKDEKAYIKELGKLPEGSVLTEKSIGTCVLEIDPKYFRPTEVELLIGDPKKAKEKLGWEPEYNLSQLISEMIKNDLTIMKKEKDLLNLGHHIIVSRES
jgi:GDPmannose 4,6-dehydratase